MKVKYTKNEQETIYLAHQVGLLLKEGMTVLLDGPLASGKTTFAKGIGLALQIDEVINSPSFTIMKMYEKDFKRLYHFDLYRMSGEGLDFDFEDYINSKGITLIEWPFNVKSLIPKEYLLVQFERINDNERKLSFQAVGEDYEKVVYYL